MIFYLFTLVHGANFYNILGNQRGLIGNIFILVVFIAMILGSTFGMRIYFSNNNKLYKYRRISSIIELSFLAIFIVAFLSNIGFGAIFLLFLSVTNLILLYKFEKNLEVK